MQIMTLSNYLNIEKQHMNLNNNRKLEKISKIQMKKIIKNLKMNKTLEMAKKKKEKIMMNCLKIRIKAWKKCRKDKWKIKIIVEYREIKWKNKNKMEKFNKIKMTIMLKMKMKLKHKTSNKIIIKVMQIKE